MIEMKTKIISNNDGVSILEVMAAVMIIAIGMVGVLSLVIQNVEAQYVNKNVLMASGLAQEGLELVRNIRDANWLDSGAAWNQSIVGDGTYAIDYRGASGINMSVNSASQAGARLYIDGNGLYSHIASAAPTNFYRLITVVDHGNYLDAQCSVRWADGAQNREYTAKTYLYDWR